VVGKVRLSPRIARDPGAGARWVAAGAAGVRAGGLLHYPTWAMAAADRSWVTTPMPGAAA